MFIQTVDNQFKFRSRRGQIPFVELNGRQIPDSNFIIGELSRIFGTNIDEHLNEREQADSCAYHSLIEDSLAWSCAYYRSYNISFLASDDGVINYFSGFRRLVFRTFSLPMLKRAVSPIFRVVQIAIIIFCFIVQTEMFSSRFVLFNSQRLF